MASKKSDYQAHLLFERLSNSGNNYGGLSNENVEQLKKLVAQELDQAFREGMTFQSLTDQAARLSRID